MGQDPHWTWFGSLNGARNSSGCSRRRAVAAVEREGGLIDSHGHGRGVRGLRGPRRRGDSSDHWSEGWEPSRGLRGPSREGDLRQGVQEAGGEGQGQAGGGGAKLRQASEGAPGRAPPQGGRAAEEQGEEGEVEGRFPCPPGRQGRRRCLEGGDGLPSVGPVDSERRGGRAVRELDPEFPGVQGDGEGHR